MIDGKLQPPKEVDFTVMGLDIYASNFLNWAMQNRDNLEFIRDCKTLEKISQSSTLHSDHLGMIQRIDDIVSHRKC